MVEMIVEKLNHCLNRFRKLPTGHQFELISFKLCPYVQRAIILLKRKKVNFKTTYIDLENPPRWFDALSPLGQVPVLKVDEKYSIFESAVICELIDELIEPHLHLKDPIGKAKERAWIEYGSSLLSDQSGLMQEPHLATALKLKADLFESLLPVEKVLGHSPFFRGKDFSLVDATYAPLFMRFKCVPGMFHASLFKKIPKTKKWADHLLELPEVKESVVPEFSEDYLKRFKGLGSALLANPD